MRSKKGAKDVVCDFTVHYTRCLCPNVNTIRQFSPKLVCMGTELPVRGHVLDLQVVCTNASLVTCVKYIKYISLFAVFTIQI